MNTMIKKRYGQIAMLVGGFLIWIIPAMLADHGPFVWGLPALAILILVINVGYVLLMKSKSITASILLTIGLMVAVVINTVMLDPINFAELSNHGWAALVKS